MKRLLLHVSFWVAYTLQDAIFAYTWIRASSSLSDGKLFSLGLEDALLCLVSKIPFTYFLLERLVKALVSGKYPLRRILWEGAAAVAVTLFIYRVVAVYIINPYIYHTPDPGRVFEVKGVLAALMDVGFVATVAATIKFARIQLVVKENEKHLVRDKLEAELKFLRSQTNPHFLLNTLNNVYALARKRSDQTPEMIMKLSELLRFILYESGGQFISLVEEIKVLEDCLELEMMRYDERLSVSFEKELDGGCYQITPLLLLPFVENAFKHGPSESRFESFVHIVIRVEEGVLNFTVENSKDNCKDAPLKENIGLVNVRRRLELTYKDYNLDIRNEGDYFRVQLILNLESHVEI